MRSKLNRKMISNIQLCCSLFLFFMSLNSFSQFTRRADSLKKIITSVPKKADTLIIKAIMDITNELFSSTPDSAYVYIDKGISICENVLKERSYSDPRLRFYATQLGGLYNNKALYHEHMGDPIKALQLHEKSLAYRKKINDKGGIALSLNNMGHIYMNKGNIPKALDLYLQSLKIREELKDKYGIAHSLISLGVIYFNQGERIKALSNFTKCAAIQEEIGDKRGLAYSYGNIGAAYFKEGDTKNAIDYSVKALEIRREINDREGECAVLVNLGVIYKTVNKNNLALECLNKALQIAEEINSRQAIADALEKLSTHYIGEKKFDQALGLSLRSLSIGQELGYPEIIRASSSRLIHIYRGKKDFKNAIHYFKLFVKMRDSIENESNRKVSIRFQLKYDFEKKAAADSVIRSKETEVKNVELLKQKAILKAKRNQQYALFGGLLLVCLLSIFMFNRWRLTQKQKHIIEEQKLHMDEQKMLVDQKQKEIIDSIHYALRIQKAQLPSERKIALNLQKLNSITDAKK
jgi:tetratricopeptide (TPR) repeat protein